MFSATSLKTGKLYSMAGEDVDCRRFPIAVIDQIVEAADAAEQAS